MFDMITIHGEAEEKKSMRWPKSHAEWNVLLIYAIPTIGVFIAALVFFIRLIS